MSDNQLSQGTVDFRNEERRAANAGPQEQFSTELVVPGLGTVVDLTKPEEVALALDDIRYLEQQYRSLKTKLTELLVAESEKQGTKTLHLPGVTVTVKSGPEVVYDAEEIEIGLRMAGMPEARIREIVEEKVTYTVKAVKAKQAAGANPSYADVIEAHKREQKKTPSASVSRAR